VRIRQLLWIPRGAADGEGDDLSFPRVPPWLFVAVFDTGFPTMFPPERCGDGEGGEGQERQAEAKEAEAAAGGQAHARVLLLLLRRGRRAGDVRQEGVSEGVPPAVSQPHQAAIR